MKLYFGTSGFSYSAWRGSFYPEKLKARDMLAYYATRLDAVEINNTFYRMPAPALLERWRDAVSPAFTFVLKAPRRITHVKRLAGCEDELSHLLEASAVLREARGPFLFQLPPFFKKDLARLRDFLALLPATCRAAFEFRHASWAEPEVTEALAARGAALCWAETDDEPAPEAATADWGYLRLRKTAYRDDELDAWAERLRAQPWREAFVFFKHEDAGIGPALAQALRGRLA